MSARRKQDEAKDKTPGTLCLPRPAANIFPSDYQIPTEIFVRLDSNVGFI
jgi:hypothetical protein